LDITPPLRDAVGKCWHGRRVLRAGGIGKGGLNFDAKVRRQSFDPEDLIYAHIGAMDLCARAFLNTVKMLEDGHLAQVVSDRYAGWQKPEAQLMLKGKMTLEEISAQAEAHNSDPLPRSGKQELLEYMINRSLF
jgi:xylose isomerase